MTQLTDGELRLMKIIWERKQLHSQDLVEICNERLGWKKSTTYTMLKKLITKGAARNEHADVSAVVTYDEYIYDQRKQVIERYFNNSLPSFVNMFAREEKLSKKDIEELEKIIKKYD
jgi:BlaI family penicillinase repressor